MSALLRQATPAAAVPVFELRSIQMLRAIAALMVVGHHARHFFPDGDHWSAFGARGVDIFFVISGFVMAHSTRNADAQGDRTGYAWNFLARRFIRVVPLYWLALLWTAKRDLAAGAAGADLAKDFVFWPHFHPVYRDGILPALAPGWTINYEMFFYGLFAVALLLGRSRRWVLPGVLVGLVAIGLMRKTGESASAAAIFYTHTVLLEFAAGLLVHAVWRRWPRLLSARSAVLVSTIALAALGVENGDRWRGFLDGVPAALLVWSCLTWLERIDLPWLRALGDASYSIYLFHLASFAVAERIAAAVVAAEPTPTAIAVVAAVHLAVASGAGWIIHRAIERPLLSALRRRSPTPGRDRP